MHPLDRPSVPRPEHINEEWKAAEAAHDAARAKYLAACDKHDAENQRLIYAAGSRCRCGAGMAYLNTAGVRGAWECSAVLKGALPIDAHDLAMPFAFWSVKSELQPSAGGATTRPAPE